MSVKIIYFAGKQIPKENIQCLEMETHRVFHYWTFHWSCKWKKEFPFFRKWRSPVWSRRELCCLAVEMKSGKVIRQFYHNTNYGGGSSTFANADRGKSEFELQMGIKPLWWTE